MHYRLQKKNCILAIGFLIFLLALFLLLIQHKQAVYDDSLVITNLAIGKADCAIIQYNDITGIIDTGEEENYEILKSNLESMNVSSIDYLILTHYDKDHVGNVVSLLNDYNVASVYVPDYVSQKQYYSQVTNALAKQNTISVSQKTMVQLNDLSFVFYPAPEAFSAMEDSLDNNMSLVVKLSFGNNSFLFCGDIETARIDYMLGTDTDIKCDWMKYPHHNLYQKAAKDLIKVAVPDYVVMSYGDDPGDSEKVKNFLEKRGISYFDTSSKNIVTISDGDTISVE